MKVYNLENIKFVVELKYWIEVISMNECFIIVFDIFIGIV